MCTGRVLPRSSGLGLTCYSAVGGMYPKIGSGEMRFPHLQPGPTATTCR